MKRFEHSGQGSKVETFVRIPTELDMTPYTSKSIKLRSKKLKKDTGKRMSTRIPFDSK
jgi:hypothetical protein